MFTAAIIGPDPRRRANPKRRRACAEPDENRDGAGDTGAAVSTPTSWFSLLFFFCCFFFFSTINPSSPPRQRRNFVAPYTRTHDKKKKITSSLSLLFRANTFPPPPAPPVHTKPSLAKPASADAARVPTPKWYYFERILRTAVAAAVTPLPRRCPYRPDLLTVIKTSTRKLLPSPPPPPPLAVARR